MSPRQFKMVPGRRSESELSPDSQLFPSSSVCPRCLPIVPNENEDRVTRRQIRQEKLEDMWGQEKCFFAKVFAL